MVKFKRKKYRIKVPLANSGLISFKQDGLKVFESNIVSPGVYSSPKSYFCNQRKAFWILGAHVTIDLLKIAFSG